MPKSTYLADKINDFIRGAASFTPPVTYYWDAMTTAPTITGGGTSSGFGRIAVTNDLTSYSTSSGGLKTNNILVDFGTNTTGSSKTIVAIAIYDASSSGNLIDFGALTTPVVVNTGQDFFIPINGGQFTES